MVCGNLNHCGTAEKLQQQILGRRYCSLEATYSTHSPSAGMRQPTAMLQSQRCTLCQKAAGVDCGSQFWSRTEAYSKAAEARAIRIISLLVDWSKKEQKSCWASDSVKLSPNASPHVLAEGRATKLRCCHQLAYPIHVHSMRTRGNELAAFGGQLSGNELIEGKHASRRCWRR